MNNAILYIKYSELTLKQKNRNDFIKILNKNTKLALKDISCSIIAKYDYMVIENIASKSDLEIIVDKVKLIPGFQYLTIAHSLEKDFKAIKSFILENKSEFKDYKTFKVEARRQDKNFSLNSMQISQELGGFFLKNFDHLKVDVRNPDFIFDVEVKNSNIFVYWSKIECAKGLPVGTSKRLLVLLSGGIDSPVASRMMLERGSDLVFLTFITPPHTCSNSLEKVKKLSNIITNNFSVSKNSKLLVCNYTNCMHEIAHISEESYKINLMRRSFFRIANKLAKKYGCEAIVTGESLGQVASQTLESMYTINEVIKDGMLVFRPLIGFDKNSIIALAKKFNTYEVSIEQFPDSCSLFAPKHPVTKPKLETSIKLEQELDLLFSLEEKAIENVQEYNGDK